MWRWSFFWLSASCGTILSPDLLFINETVFNPGIRRQKKSLIWLSLMSESSCRLVISISQNHNWNSITSFRITILNRGWKAVSSNASPGWTVCYLEAMIAFPKRGRQDSSNGPNVASRLVIFSVFTSIVYASMVITTRCPKKRHFQ
jgi:hypothetical protein